MSMEQLQYPIGRPDRRSPLDAPSRAAKIDQIAALPAELREAVAGLSEDQLDRNYREGGWTVRQLVHHLADSHINAFCRFRLGVTEEHPTIRPYDEAAWARLPDVAATPIEASLGILDGVHARLAALLRGLPAEAFARTVFHPEGERTLTLDELLGEYSWHGRHHIAHIHIATGRQP